MKKPRRTRPEEALELQLEIEVYLKNQRVMSSEFGPPTGYQQRHDKALEDRDFKFFEDMAAFCRMESNRSAFSQDEPLVRRLAVQSRIWLELNQKPGFKERLLEPVLNADDIDVLQRYCGSS